MRQIPIKLGDWARESAPRRVPIPPSF